jgi:hypothetical protein
MPTDRFTDFFPHLCRDGSAEYLDSEQILVPPGHNICLVAKHRDKKRKQESFSNKTEKQQRDAKKNLFHFHVADRVRQLRLIYSRLIFKHPENCEIVSFKTQRPL